MFNQINGYVREYPTKYGLNKATNVPPVEDPGQFPLIRVYITYIIIASSIRLRLRPSGELTGILVEKGNHPRLWP